MLRKLRTLIKTRFLILMLLLISVQQVLIAAGTGVLALAGKNIDKPFSFLLYACAFLGLSILPYFITILIRKYETEGFTDAYRAFIEGRLLQQTGKAQFWPEMSHKEHYLTAIGPEAETYVTACVFSCFDMYLYLISIASNVITLSFIVEGKFVYAYGISAILSGLVFKLYNPKVAKSVEQEQQTKLQRSSYLLRAWDNVFLKNPVVNQAYASKLKDLFDQDRMQSGQCALKAESLVFFLTFTVFVPVFGLVIWLVLSHLQEPSFLAAMMVTLPRQLQVLTHFRFFFQQAAHLTTFMKRLDGAWRNSELKESPLERRIKIGNIRCNNEEIMSLDGFVHQMKRQSVGRYVITGPNGSGKSTLLIHLNCVLDNSFYLPPAPNLEIGVDLGAESTGQRVLKHLEHISQQRLGCLLLDEWDANLDQSHRQLISLQLDELAKTCPVVEVRH